MYLPKVGDYVLYVGPLTYEADEGEEIDVGLDHGIQYIIKKIKWNRAYTLCEITLDHETNDYSIFLEDIEFIYRPKEIKRLP